MSIDVMLSFHDSFTNSKNRVISSYLYKHKIASANSFSVGLKNCVMLLYLFQIFLWLAYGVLHSTLADNRVKLFFVRRMGKGYGYYRLIYNALAVILLAGIIVYQFMLPKQSLWAFDWRIHVAATIVKYTGLVIAVFAIAGYNLKEFLGLTFSPRDAAAGSGTLKTDGLLRYVRHPIYTGTILFVWGLFLSDSLLRTLIMAACITIYTLIGIYFEERKLLAEFGDAYQAYCRRVPMLWPKLW